MLEMAGDRRGEHLLLETEKIVRYVLRLRETAARNKIFAAACRIPVWSFVVVVKAGQRTPAEGTITGENMPQFLVAVHHPDNYNPNLETRNTLAAFGYSTQPT